MSHSVVTIRLNGHPYQIGCEVGEEDHVAELGKEVELVLQSLVKSAGQIGEARLLAMVALILADRAAAPAIDVRDTGDGHASSEKPLGANVSDAAAAEALENAAVRIAALASKLASGTTNS